VWPTALVFESAESLLIKRKFRKKNTGALSETYFAHHDTLLTIVSTPSLSVPEPSRIPWIEQARMSCPKVHFTKQRPLSSIQYWNNKAHADSKNKQPERTSSVTNELLPHTYERPLAGRTSETPAILHVQLNFLAFHPRTPSAHTLLAASKQKE
jgi:hypothetical protein